MNFRAFFDEDNLLWEALVLSIGIHFFLLHVGEFSFQFQKKHTVEIDITNMGHIASRTAAAPPKPAAPKKEWVKPAPQQKVIPAPIPTQPVPAPSPEEAPTPLPEEYAIGTDGSANALSRLPQLLNLSDLSAIFKRYYPEEARAQRKESTVVLDLHIDTDGRVQSVDIIRSGGSEFDDAAQKVAKLLRFTPAFIGSRRVAVKLRQPIEFKLANS